MIIVDVEQRSFEWLEARQGIPTGSQISRLLTEKTRKYSVLGARKYRNELLAEWFLDASLDGGNTLWMDRGTMLETEARQYYELLRDVELDEVGFCLRDDRRFGGSPDALVKGCRRPSSSAGSRSSARALQSTSPTYSGSTRRSIGHSARR